MSNKFDKKIIWVVVEANLAGTRNQCIGVAEALGAPYILKEFTVNPWLANMLTFIPACTTNIFTPAFKGPWPDLIIAGGRKAVYAIEAIKRCQPDVKTVFLQNPGRRRASIDLIAAPMHDGLSGENLFQTQGAPNRITPELLAAQPKMKDREAPVTLVLIGGKSKSCRLTADWMRGFVNKLNALPGTLLITASRRTGAEAMTVLKNNLAHPHATIWDGKGDNPYFTWLAAAQYIICTSDSVSMLSDAATTGKPLYIAELPCRSARLKSFHSLLISGNTARPFTGKLESFSYPAWHDAHDVAKAIEERLYT